LIEEMKQREEHGYTDVGESDAKHNSACKRSFLNQPELQPTTKDDLFQYGRHYSD